MDKLQAFANKLEVTAPSSMRTTGNSESGPGLSQYFVYFNSFSTFFKRNAVVNYDPAVRVISSRISELLLTGCLHPVNTMIKPTSLRPLSHIP